jgi:hypothetical protein
MTIKGFGFLWHQVRCMASVLFLIGQGLEEPQVIDQLLDTEKNARKPDYLMASDLPLVLWDNGFEGIEWSYKPGTFHVSHLLILLLLFLLFVSLLMLCIGALNVLGDIDVLRRVQESFRENWQHFLLKASVARAMMTELDHFPVQTSLGTHKSIHDIAVNNTHRSSLILMGLS